MKLMKFLGAVPMRFQKNGMKNLHTQVTWRGLGVLYPSDSMLSRLEAPSLLPAGKLTTW